MRFRFSFHPGVALVLLAGAIVSYNIFKAPKDPTWDFIHRVLLTWEYKAGKKGIVRWVRPVTLGVKSAKPADLKILRELVRDLNVLLEGSGVSVTLGALESANALVIFGPREKFPFYAKRYGYRQAKEDWGVGITRHNDQLETTFTVSIIPDEATGLERKRLILEEVVQGFGPANDAPQFWDSIFFQRGKYVGEAARMSDLDRKLLHFLYLYLKPSDDTDAVRRAYQKYWSTMEVPARP